MLQTTRTRESVLAEQTISDRRIIAAHMCVVVLLFIVPGSQGETRCARVYECVLLVSLNKKPTAISINGGLTCSTCFTVVCEIHQFACCLGTCVLWVWSVCNICPAIVEPKRQIICARCDRWATAVLTSHWMISGNGWRTHTVQRYVCLLFTRSRCARIRAPSMIAVRRIPSWRSMTTACDHRVPAIDYVVIHIFHWCTKEQIMRIAQTAT